MTKLKHSYSVLIEQTCFDCIEKNKQKQLPWNFTHYVFAENYIFHWNSILVKVDFVVDTIFVEKKSQKQ